MDLACHLTDTLSYRVNLRHVDTVIKPECLYARGRNTGWDRLEKTVENLEHTHGKSH